LHSMTAPVAEAVNPEPDTVTLCPFVRPVDGVTWRVPEAPASAAKTSTPVPERTSNAAVARMTRG
jgi:hypothetical protein